MSLSRSEFLPHLDTSFATFLNEHLVNLRILVFVINLRSACGLDFQSFDQIFDLVSKPPWLQSQIACRFAPRIEMLMKPFGRWHKQATRLPVDARALFPLLPQERIPFTGKNKDMRPGTMPMSPRISAHRIFLDMRADGIGRKMKQNAPGTLPSSAMFHQTKPGNIRNEIRIPCSMTLNLFSLPAEVTILAAESI